MNHQLIENWNSVVRPEDTVYHLGDFSFLAAKQARDVIECLNGTIKVVRGNHDENSHFYYDLLDFFGTTYINVRVGDSKIEMCHYPEKLGVAAADFHMCGHIHTQWRSWEKPDGTVIYNVGVDEWDYHPITLDDIVKDMASPKHRVTGEWKDAYHG